MTIAYFATFRGDVAISADDRARVSAVVAATPGLSRGLVHTPAQTHDPYLDDGRPPSLVLQLYFANVAALEAALGHAGHLRALSASNALPSLRGAPVTQQAMEARSFPVPDPRPGMASRCSYLVTYEGEADDLDAWVAHYTTRHTAVMARFPRIREIEVCTRVEWRGSLPWPRVNHMVRNKVVFDDAAALTAALNSPVRHEMRADFRRFSTFTGPVTHFAMFTSPASAGEVEARLRRG